MLNNYHTELLTIRDDWCQHGHKQFVPLFFPFLRGSFFKTSRKGHLNLQSLFSFSLLLRVFNFNPSVVEGRLNAPLFNLNYQNRFVFLLCIDGRRLSFNYNRSETHDLKYKGKPVNIEDIRKFKWTDRNDGRSTSREIASVRSSGECEFLAELSLFALQESNEATLYKWAKFLSILNIILTC